jgi:hypothetical protein
MANKINGNRDGINGRNKTYSIPGRSSSISRETIVKEINQGKHPNHSTYKRNGIEYARANPNPEKYDNVNKN